MHNLPQTSPSIVIWHEDYSTPSRDDIQGHGEFRTRDVNCPAFFHQVVYDARGVEEHPVIGAEFYGEPNNPLVHGFTRKGGRMNWCLIRDRNWREKESDVRGRNSKSESESTITVKGDPTSRHISWPILELQLLPHVQSAAIVTRSQIRVLRPQQEEVTYTYHASAGY
jgi:hypothetical protein